MLDWLANKWNEWVDLIFAFWQAVLDFVHDSFFWILDNLFQAVALILDGLVGLFQGLNPLQYITAIPPETQYYMAVCGFNDCMSMIVASLGIRFLLQLIPFVRLGS